MCSVSIPAQKPTRDALDGPLMLGEEDVVVLDGQIVGIVNDIELS